MHEYQNPSQSQLKVQKFKTQIRRKNREQYMSKIRTKFLEQQKAFNQTNQNPGMEKIFKLLSQEPSKQNVSQINRIIIFHRDSISDQLFCKIVLYVKQNFCNRGQRMLAQKIQLNDLIALLGNLLAFQSYSSIIKNEINFPILVDKIFDLIKIAPKSFSSLAFWILFQTMSICPVQTAQRVKQNHKILIQKIRESDINLSYLISKVMDDKPKSIQYEIIQQYSMIPINKSTCLEFIRNIVNIFEGFVHENCQSTHIQIIINWIIFQLLSPQYPSQLRQHLFKFLQNIISTDMDLGILNNIINQEVLINQIIQRSLFDSYYENKITCIRILNQIVRKSPKLQLQQLMYSFPSIITTLSESLSLIDYKIVISSLMSIGKLTIQFQNSNQFKSLIQQSRLKFYIQTLQYSKNQEISQFSAALLEEYLQ